MDKKLIGDNVQVDFGILGKYSYKEVDTLEGRKFLKEVKLKGITPICGCNGAKLYLRNIGEGAAYILCKMPSYEHENYCCKGQWSSNPKILLTNKEIDAVFDYIIKGVSGVRIENNIESNSKISRKDNLTQTQDYKKMFGLGQYIIVMANDYFCENKHYQPNQSKMYELLYQRGEYQHIESPLKSGAFAVKSSRGKLTDEKIESLYSAMYKPWINKNKPLMDYTNNFKYEILKRNEHLFNNLDKQRKILDVKESYILMKYISHTEIGEQVKLKLNANGNMFREENSYIEIYVQKKLFYKEYNKRYDTLVNNKDVDLFVSAMVTISDFEKEDISKEILKQKDINVARNDIAFIPVVKNTCIPIESSYELHVIKELISKPNLLITRIAELDKNARKEFFNKKPDFIITNKKTNIRYICEVFGLTNEIYINKMLEKIETYSSDEFSKYKFVAYFENLLELDNKRNVLTSKERYWLHPSADVINSNKGWTYLSKDLRKSVERIINKF